MRRLALILPAVLLACGPIPLPQAERECYQRARLAQQPRGEIAVGMDSGGQFRSRMEIDITSDYIAGRDPAKVYNSCVFQKSGQAPSRPLYSFPDWKG